MASENIFLLARRRAATFVPVCCHSSDQHVSRADVNVVNPSGQTASDIAKFWSHFDVIEALVGDKDHSGVSLYNQVNSLSDSKFC